LEFRRWEGLRGLIVGRVPCWQTQDELRFLIIILLNEMRLRGLSLTVSFLDSGSPVICPDNLWRRLLGRGLRLKGRLFLLPIRLCVILDISSKFIFLYH